MSNFTLYDLSILANAVEHERRIAKDDYVQRMATLDRISQKLRQEIDSLEGEKYDELRERGFYENYEEEFQ